MSIGEAESPERILASDVVPVHVAGLLRHVQATYQPERGMAITLEVDESLYASADPDLLIYALGVLLSVSCLGQPEFGTIALSCESDAAGIRIQAEGEPGPTPVAAHRPIGLEMAFAQQAIASMNGVVELGGASGRLFRLTLAPARPSRITSRPPGAPESSGR